MRIDGCRVFHIVARIHPPERSLCDLETGTWVWNRLRNALPGALSTALMPDHLHAIAPLEDPAAMRERLNRMLGHLGRRLGSSRRIGEVAEPRQIVDRLKLLRNVRYVGEAEAAPPALATLGGRARVVVHPEHGPLAHGLLWPVIVVPKALVEHADARSHAKQRRALPRARRIGRRSLRRA